MNAKNVIAAALLIATGSAFAAEAPEALAAANGTGAATVVTADASTPSLPAAREAAKEETADIVKHYKTPLAIQLDQYKN